MTHWSEQQIIAYVDGKLDLAEGRALHRDRQNDPQLDAYISSLEIDIDQLVRDGEQMLDGAPQFDFEKPPAKMPMWKQSAIAASIAVVFAFGFLTSKFMPGNNPPPGTWLQAVAEYQMLYSGQTLELLQKTDDQKGREIAEIGRKLDIILASSDLRIDGLTYKRGQLLNYKNMPLVQFAYLDKDGTPIAFCVIKRGKEKVAPITDKKFVAGQSGAVWYQGNFGYVVIGKTDPEKLHAIAKKLKTRMASL